MLGALFIVIIISSLCGHNTFSVYACILCTQAHPTDMLAAGILSMQIVGVLPPVSAQAL